MATISRSTGHDLPHPPHGGHGHDHDVSYLHPKGGLFTVVWDWMSTADSL